ncbi:MFS transporter [Microbacterium telephonicum]|uniref:DHA3 family multidrug efflux protein-like MFS transporter n=1 Tax=Microbacterium telephonicum TaxID=1714841 RepID=A0A498BWP3_9MICO|nr:MFS transporter [Microbacterium telephonicum]RLK48074.1 DHA3 family multidrug efflux protein-like MFS transporter [Microbacterium telephonicum]
MTDHTGGRSADPPPGAAASTPDAASADLAPPGGQRVFLQVLINTAVANVTTSFLWFALTFWAYLQTQSVLATGIIGGAYMLLIALFGMVFGTVVDRHRKHRVMLMSGLVTLAAFVVCGGMWIALGEQALSDLGQPWFWLFSTILLAGAVIENLRNIALSTTVTLLVPVERHANANGLVGTVQGLAFMVTSVFSGLSVGLLGMGWTLALAIAFTVLAFLHLLFIRIPEPEPAAPAEKAPLVDLRGSWRAVSAVGGLFALILFSMLNNLVGGVYMALMDPYGLELFPVEWWGVILGVTATGFIIGGALIAKFGLGRNPIRTMLLFVMVMGALGSLFTIREWGWLYVVGIWAYMCLIPVIEASEQTVIQKIVPYETQGRVFGFAQAFEAAAAPVTAFLIAPLAQFWLIPFMDSDAGARTWGWLLGDGEARGIALVFFFAGIIMIAIAALAFTTKAYRTLSAEYADQPASVPVAEAPGPETRTRAGVTDVEHR